ncbi:MAG: PCYCGC motif-containing (lipo)protein, partial [Candidatus Hodarchaeales archaeon]
PFLKVFILSIIILSSSFVLINLFNNPDHSPSVSIDKELPENMIHQYDPRLLTEDYINNAYDYAKTNSLLLEQLKCYCGCKSFHDNNRQCFWKDDGSLDSHAETCGVCVYIALAAKQLNEEGWSAQEIRSFIDSKY